jgi:hypothetical protein
VTSIGNQRDRERRPYTPCGPASWTMGTDNLKLCTIGKKLFCTGPTGSAVQFFMLPLPSKIHRPNSVSTGNEPVNIKQGFKFFWGFGPKLVSYMSYVSLSLYILNHFAIINSVLSCISYYFIGIYFPLVLVSLLLIFKLIVFRQPDTLVRIYLFLSLFILIPHLCTLVIHYRLHGYNVIV